MIDDRAHPSHEGDPVAPDGRKLAALLAIAEGRPLTATQQRAAERLGDDPATAAAIERQRRVAHALRGGGPAVPAGLRARVDSVPEHPRRSWRLTVSRPRPRGLRVSRAPRLAAGGALIAAAASAVLVLALAGVIGTTGTRAVSASRVAEVWKLPATAPSPPANAGQPAELALSFHSVVYPNYHDPEGWHSAGVREDRIGGRLTRTVIYRVGPRRQAAYTVFPETGLRVPADAMHLEVNGVRLTEFRTGDRWVVTFVRNHSTCVLTAAAPRERQWLIRLAAWHGGPAVTPA